MNLGTEFTITTSKRRRENVGKNWRKKRLAWGVSVKV